MPDNAALQRLSEGLRPIEAVRLSLLGPAARLAFRSREAGIGPAGEAFGVALPREANRFGQSGSRFAFWLGPDEWLLLAPGEDAAPLAAAIEAATLGVPHALVDVSSRSVGIEIAGREAAFALNQGCPLDLSLAAFPIGMCTRTLLGKAEIVLVRLGPELFHLDVWRSFAPYVIGYLDEARREFA
ncbi:sarcosine oxidase subunit gamma [Ancylobacter sp. A5.8]|uniref:sarcosine oxidase subunit gamma n=1 Tax=Ancylobacter gelatini TaxID=2919920 RepID=UPI001F4E8740|nr:sarcosine oxidase subunit gamma family protein [Ancylobacter gelatini]MCJ8144783.1 sarcosine oxidase subunit gamma [Ancylobacter gelatini]